MENSPLTQSNEGYAEFVQETKTYSVTKKQGRFKIYELDRKKKPVLVRSFKAKKKQTLKSVVKDVKAKKIKFQIRYITTRDTPTNKVTIKQFNTTPRFKTGSLRNVQMIALVQINDENRKVVITKIGFSRKQNAPFNKFKINHMENQCIDYAIKTYVAENYYATDDYKDTDIPSNITAEILQRRFQYVTKTKSRI